MGLSRLLPQSLVGRVYALYSAALLFFVGISLGLFLNYQYSQAIDDAQQSATMLVEVAAQTITESAVIGDYDTIKRTLEKSILRSQFASAMFIDLQGGSLRAENNDGVGAKAPAWLRERIAHELYDINRNITAGGTDYGVLRLVFASASVADALWHLVQAAFWLALLSLAGGMGVIWFPLKRWLGKLDQVYAIEQDIRHGDAAAAVTVEDLPLEFRGTFEVLQRTADSLRKELDARKQTLASLRAVVSGMLPPSDTVDGVESDDIAELTETIVRLVDERESSRQALEFAKEAAEAANRAKSAFLANMSHEIRTPMNGIMGMTDLALESDSEDERQEYMEIVKRSAAALLDILNDILDLSKIEAGKLSLEEVDFDLRATLDDVLRALKPRANEKKLAFRCEIPDAVPNLLRGDPTRLRQVMLNLLGNAIKFTENGEVAGRLGISHRQPGQVTIHFAVSDTGIGIPADKLDNIFEAFSQADTSTTRRFGGTGLGLTITRHLVELMGGHLQVESQLGQGSTFSFELAFAVDEALINPEIEQVKAAQPAVVSFASPLTVLLVEDNPINQRVAQTLLGKWGHQVTLAHDGRMAVDLIAAGQRFDVILMDMQMPVMGGIEATQMIRQLEAEQHQSAQPIIAMTANAMQGDREACLQAGMDDYLAKPINSNELANKLLQLTAAAAD